MWYLVVGDAGNDGPGKIDGGEEAHVCHAGVRDVSPQLQQMWLLSQMWSLSYVVAGLLSNVIAGLWSNVAAGTSQRPPDML